MKKRAKKDLLHSIISKFGIVTRRSYDPTIIDRVDQYLKDGFKVKVKCSNCNNVHDIYIACQVCDKEYNGYE